MNIKTFRGDVAAKRKSVFSLMGLLLIAVSLVSCKDSIIYEDPVDCISGVQLRFVYDYHMEPGANAFPANVDCVSVVVMDTLGNYITHFSETSDILMDENYRMTVTLDEPGVYDLVAFGGITCDNPAFTFTPDWFKASRANGTRDDIRLTLPLNEEGVSNNKLHDIVDRTGGLFYGCIRLNLTEDDLNKRGKQGLRTELMPMMKDTNNIQVILQELAHPYQIDVDDYNFYIIDDNFVLDGYNKPVHIARDDFKPYYKPYARGNRDMGKVLYQGNHGQSAEVDTVPVQVACAEFSVSRLLIEHIPTSELVITSKVMKDDDGNDKEVVRIPLITYLASTRGFGQNWIRDNQEYLDRQSNWTLMFFLQRNVWMNARVVVNEWVVRVNEIELTY